MDRSPRMRPARFDLRAFAADFLRLVQVASPSGASRLGSGRPRKSINLGRRLRLVAMLDQKFRRHPKPIPIGRKEFGLSKVGASRFDLRDPYHHGGQPALARLHSGDAGLLAGDQPGFRVALRAQPRRRRQYRAGLIRRRLLFQHRDFGHGRLRGDGAGHAVWSYRLGGGNRQRHDFHGDRHRTAVRPVLPPQGEDRLCRRRRRQPA